MNKWLRFFPLLFLLGLFVVIDQPIYAQQTEQWTTPVQLSVNIKNSEGQQADAYNEVMVADSTGIVHAFWAARIDTKTPAIGDTLYYSRWDGVKWSQPVDIFYVPGDVIWWPQVDIDREDRIHIVWVSNGFVWYSHVYAKEAGSVKAWSKPVQVNNENTTNASIAIGSDGTIHIAYAAIVGDSNKILYTHSEDGNAWIYPVELFTMKEWFLPKLYVDERLRVHLVFGALGAGEAIYYMRSDETGLNWSDPVIVDKRDDRYGKDYGPAWINVITHGTDEVHLVWDGAPYGQRWHQWSSDGGKTWSPAEQISDEVHGLTGTNAMIFDSTGLLHLFTLGVKGTPPYYGTRQNGIWSSLEPIASQYTWDGEGPALAISGDQLVATWWNRSEMAIEVFASSLKINGTPMPIHTPDATPTQPTASQVPVVALSPTAAIQAMQTSQLTAVFPSTPTLQADSLSLSTILILGSLPVILIIGVIILSRWIKR
jgi:hypothetical protein